MSKVEKEDRNLVILFITFLLVLSLYLIFSLLIKEENKNKERKEVLSNYYLVNNSKNYKLYKINDNIFNNFNLNINNLNISYQDNILTVNDNKFDNKIKLVNSIGFYDNTLVLFANDIDNNTSYCIYYYIDKNTYYILDQIDNMSIYNIDISEMAEAGLILYITYVKDNQLVIDGKNYPICSYTNNKTILSKSILLVYDLDTKQFDSYDTIDKKYIKDIAKDYCTN